jgi:hypothetical protein
VAPKRRNTVGSTTNAKVPTATPKQKKTVRFAPEVEAAARKFTRSKASTCFLILLQFQHQTSKLYKQRESHEASPLMVEQLPRTLQLLLDWLEVHWLSMVRSREFKLRQNDVQSSNQTKIIQDLNSQAVRIIFKFIIHVVKLLKISAATQHRSTVEHQVDEEATENTPTVFEREKTPDASNSN